MSANDDSRSSARPAAAAAAASSAVVIPDSQPRANTDVQHRDKTAYDAAVAALNTELMPSAIKPPVRDRDGSLSGDVLPGCDFTQRMRANILEATSRSRRAGYEVAMKYYTLVHHLAGVATVATEGMFDALTAADKENDTSLVNNFKAFDDRLFALSKTSRTINTRVRNAIIAVEGEIGLDKISWLAEHVYPARSSRLWEAARSLFNRAVTPEVGFQRLTWAYARDLEAKRAAKPRNWLRRSHYVASDFQTAIHTYDSTKTVSQSFGTFMLDYARFDTTGPGPILADYDRALDSERLFWGQTEVLVVDDVHRVHPDFPQFAAERVIEGSDSDPCDDIGSNVVSDDDDDDGAEGSGRGHLRVPSSTQKRRASTEHGRRPAEGATTTTTTDDRRQRRRTIPQVIDLTDDTGPVEVVHTAMPVVPLNPKDRTMDAIIDNRLQHLDIPVLREALRYEHTKIGRYCTQVNLSSTVSIFPAGSYLLGSQVILQSPVAYLMAVKALQPDRKDEHLRFDIIGLGLPPMRIDCEPGTFRMPNYRLPATCAVIILAITRSGILLEQVDVSLDIVIPTDTLLVYACAYSWKSGHRAPPQRQRDDGFYVDEVEFVVDHGQPKLWLLSPVVQTGALRSASVPLAVELPLMTALAHAVLGRKRFDHPTVQFDIGSFVEPSENKANKWTANWMRGFKVNVELAHQKQKEMVQFMDELKE